MWIRRTFFFLLVIGQVITATLPAQAARRIKESSVPTPSSYPKGITAGPDGDLWFAEGQGNNISRINIAGVVTEHSVPTPYSTPIDIAVGPDSNLWFTEATGNN